jgi:uncharacterized protein involved in response to NO
MARGQSETKGGGQHVAFQPGFIWTALAVALLVGFPLGTHLTFVMGFSFPLGRGFASFVQLHGHVQLVGWAGLFVMGISLHFLPRLAGVPFIRPEWLSRILWLMVGGLGLRSLGQAVLPYLSGQSVFVPVVWLGVASGVLEWSGILGYVYVLIRTFCQGGDASQRPALRSVRPYFGMMLTGWVVYACLNLVLLVQMALIQAVVLHPAWQQYAVQSFLGLVLLPAAFAFSVRMLPLYLRLPVPGWPVRGTAYAYLVALTMQVLPTAPPLSELAPRVASHLESLGMLCKGGVILWFVWQLDVLTHRQEPRTVHRQSPPGPGRRTTRAGLPEDGAFGRFDRLVYAAYVWLVLAAFGEVVSGVTALVGQSFFLGSHTIRHMYLLGFITLLIFGMAVRMLPGFLHKRQVARPALVEATFWLGNTAAACRVLWFVLPPGVLQEVPGSMWLVSSAFAVSGLLGLAAVWCLAVNVWQTATKNSRR